MKKISQQATEIFSQILEKLGTQSHVKLESSGFMPLTVEVLNRFITTAAGEGTIYSLCHYYEMNGDLMRDPEMCFLVVDCRKEPTDFKNLHVCPQMFQQDSFPLYEESIEIENNTVVAFWPGYQHQHCLFANQWLKNIQQQGFLK
ncbi:hypothetical protein HGH92_23520 [Chitinophaga varians]|uniref:DUF6908 domain-containing protein n=1 Tax=Chitinophaga varians TaxID=2202339 RepID=A0A847RZ63_9BACT|nr:hypothetical protein [Chitinophaga varians]NLR67294.1 hypothetical protein [Chitinophaga varians]